MMFGVILYLRLGLVTSYVGPLEMSTIIALSAAIMLITAASITSVVTNMQIGGGGVYFLISRSLGIEIGGAIGLSLYFSQIISISLCVTGFSVAFHDAFPQFSLVWIEVLTLLLLTLLSVVSTDLALKTQFIILIILICSIISAFMGSMEGVTEVPSEPFIPGGLTFWQAFSMFFPAMTGIEAGMAMSGTLKNPSKSLSIGTFFALLTSFCVYLVLSLFLYFSIPTKILQNDPLVLLQFGASSKLIILGIWGATLSSILGSLLGAPRMLQAISEDGILPEFLTRTHGKNKEPTYALMMTFLVSLFVVLFTSIDQIIPILTMICLISYGTLNLVTALASLINSPSWRPLFNTPWYLSLLGAFCCFAAMFMIDPGWTFIAIFLVVALYLIVRRKEIDVSFKDIRQSIIFFFSRLALYRLPDAMDDAQNWHPQLVAFIGSPQENENAIYLTQSLTRRSGILSFATVIPEQLSHDNTADQRKKMLEDFYEKHKIPCIVDVSIYPTVDEGIENMIRSYGIGPFQPNTIFLPCKFEDRPFPFIDVALETRKNVMLYYETHKGPVKTFKKTLNPRSKKIDVWYDSEERSGFELVLSYVNSLTESPSWRGAKVYLKAIASDLTAKHNIQEYLEDFIKKSRLKMKPKVYLHETEDLTYFLKSKDADLCFISLKSHEFFDEAKDFRGYYQKLMKQINSLKASLIVLAGDEINHQEIYYQTK